MNTKEIIKSGRERLGMTHQAFGDAVGVSRGEMSKMEGSIRADMAKVEGSIRTDMHKEFTAQTWRIIGAMLTFGAMLTTATFFIARYVK